MALGGLAGGVIPTSVRAQEPRPEITPGQRKAPKKKDAGPRAVAVLQMSANGKASVVPIAILINGKFYDATAYKADPVPMALEQGTVYEGERTGNSLGLFTVNSALKATAVNAETPWIGTGVWLPTGSEGASKGMKAESAPKGIERSDEPPRLTKNPDATKREPEGGSAPAASGAPGSSAPAAKAPSGDEPPRLSKPAGSTPDSGGAGQSGSGAPAAGQSSPSSSTPSIAVDTKGDKSADAKDGEKKSDAAANVPASDSGAAEGNRPKLRRGKPETSFADEEVPGYSRPGARPSTKQGGNGPLVATAAQKGPVQIVPAISDASGPDPRSYTFEWLKGEEDDRRKEMTSMAKEQLRAYLAARAKAQIVPKTAVPHTTHIVAKKPVEPILSDVQMVAYDLWTSNQPVIVYSATAQLPPPAPGAPQSAVQNDLQYSILLVAYPDTYNGLHKIYAGVTDRFHLDITPRLELIDAVDADGDNRGELLFRETSDAGTGWVIYRATADRLWKMYDSLNPE